MSIHPRLVDQYTYQDIFCAYLDCRAHKRHTRVAREFELDSFVNLIQLLDEINSGKYVIGRSRGFVVTYPKPREVWASAFRDRIVHHLVCRDIMPFFESRIIPQNCACIQGRGTLYAAKYVERYCRSITENWSKKAYYLQIDIQNFFVSIYKPLLWDIIVKTVKDDKSLTMRLFKQIIFHDPTKNAIVRHDTDFSVVPRRKSLLYCPPEFGMPIGDLPSQLCASWILLNLLDQYVKHTLKCKYYVRYVDDAWLASKSPDELLDWLYKIAEFLEKECMLHISFQKSFIKPIDDGINFVGYYILPHRTYPRRMTIHRAFLQIKNTHKPFNKKEICTINSYLGLIQHTNSYRLRRELCERTIFRDFVGCDKEYTKIFSIF